VAPDIVDFQVRHAELMFEGNVFFRRFEYRLLVDFSEPRIMKDAFLQWRQSAWLAVRVGQFKLPFGFQRYLRSTYYDFVDLSETMAAFSLERDVGVMVLGRPLGGRLQYQLAISNGAGAGQPNDNRDLAYTARVVAAPWGPLPDSEGDRGGRCCRSAPRDTSSCCRRTSWCAPTTRRPTSMSTPMAWWTPSPSGRAESSCGLNSGAPPSRPRSSAGSSTRGPRPPTAAPGASTRRPAIS
jgi:hypothetical protein